MEWWSVMTHLLKELLNGRFKKKLCFGTKAFINKKAVQCFAMASALGDCLKKTIIRLYPVP
ncbi:hypothetical protein BGI40_00005 [Snodgrassella communis]|nr:hypothetical protein BGI29_09230 [Snodgrassella communis]PIT28041.1 hypothetical protein BGI39_06280 [Snodgrassella communis]PIT30134.1 hypothetical protein BGI38_01545 [Snodgrassella communis]PIT36234.1 hypothetical protein BGI40_01910 [Snodgrassella communis]PIT37228.1 hypothetical protein BGI40_01120 [Snodgrassella communis]